MSKSRCILIDSANREVREAEYECGVSTDHPASLNRLIGGYIESAWSSESFCDVLFVDEKGLFKPQNHFFIWSPRRDGVPLPGNGVIVGQEVEDDSPAGYHTRPPLLDVATVRKCVRFLDRRQVDSWAKANASEPASAITAIGDDGRPVTKVTGRYGALYGDMPQPEEDAS